MNLTELSYGNPSIDTLQYINAHSYLDWLFKELTDDKHAFPANDTAITRSELNLITQSCGILQTDKEVQKRYERYDLSLLNFYTDVKFDTKEETEEYHKLLLSVFEDVLPLIFKLKHQWQRPRPYQLALYYKLKLFPFYSYCADNGSYPCLHACVSRVLATVLGNQYTGAVKYFTDIASDIADSRVYMGLNFPSSVEYAKTVADKITTEPEFVKKYKL